MSAFESVRPLVVGIGELLWDLLPAGRQLGGAPSNFAFHAYNLGARAVVVSRVGGDRMGQEILARFQSFGLSTEAIQVDDEVPTGLVDVTLDASGSPLFAVRENAAWDCLAPAPSALAAMRQADAICFGSLAQRSPVARQTIHRLLAAASGNSLRLFDVNLRQPFYSREVIEASLRLANVLKLNDDELSVLSQMFSLAGSVPEAIIQLARTFSLRVVALTRGSRGSLIYSGGDWSEQRPRPVKIVDTVGAGDSFSAALAVGLLMKKDLDEVHRFAADVAGYVCSQPGAMPFLPAAFRERTDFSAIGRGVRAEIAAVPKPH